jgi:hypothetical protein
MGVEFVVLCAVEPANPDASRVPSDADWPTAVREGLAARPYSIVFNDHEAAFAAAAKVDGWVYFDGAVYDATDVLLARDGAFDGDDDEPEIAIDWATLPDASLRPFAIVLRAARWPSLGALDALLPELGRDGCAVTGDVQVWTEARYLGALGERAIFERSNPGSVYMRVTFDVEEIMAHRELMSELPALARDLLPKLRAACGAVPIDIEA